MLVTGAEEPPDSQEGTSEPPWGAATRALYVAQAEAGSPWLRPIPPPQPIWCRHAHGLVSVAESCGTPKLPLTPGFHPRQHPTESPPALPKDGDGGHLQPRVGRQTGKQDFGLASGGHAGVEERVGSEYVNR